MVAGSPFRRPRRSVDPRWPVSPRLVDGRRGRVGPYLGPVRLTPTRVILGIALVGSALYLLFALLNRDQRQVPLLVSGAVALGLAFGALALQGAVETYRAAASGAAGRAFLLALGGGLAALVAFGCFSAALLLALVWETR